MNIVEYSKAVYKTARYKILDEIASSNVGNNILETKDILEVIKKEGVICIDGFFDEVTCESMIEEIDESLIQYREKITQDNEQADNRIYGANHISSLIDTFYTNEFLTDIRNAYLRRTEVEGFTLAARIEMKEGNLGSGGGWHRDTIYGKQFKAIVYLTDVSEKNGPFQYIKATHQASSKLEGVSKFNLGAFQNRISQKEVDTILNSGEYELVTYTAQKGTIILTDTTGIHRGAPLREGCRYALTNYYFTNSIPSHIKNILVTPKK